MVKIQEFSGILTGKHKKKKKNKRTDLSYLVLNNPLAATPVFSLPGYHANKTLNNFIRRGVVNPYPASGNGPAVRIIKVTNDENVSAFHGKENVLAAKLGELAVYISEEKLTSRGA